MDSSLKQCGLLKSAGNSGGLAGPSSKTSPDSSLPTSALTLRQWLERWSEPNLLYQKAGGKTPAWLLDPSDSSSGQFWTRNGSEFRSGAVASSLSEILETGEVDRRYFLSAKACAGILRRAEKRGKALPPFLRAALLAVASAPTSTVTEDSSPQQLPASMPATEGCKVAPAMAVRRLTPKEAERLQGFPDGYTKINEKTADGPRYKALGNSFAVPVVNWIGRRIQLVDMFT